MKRSTKIRFWRILKLFDLNISILAKANFQATIHQRNGKKNQTKEQI